MAQLLRKRALNQVREVTTEVYQANGEGWDGKDDERRPHRQR
jgi:hypothetical protein